VKEVRVINETYENLENGFRSWLETLGYAKSTVTGSPALVREFFFYLENKEILELEQVNNQVIKDYFVYLQQRKHARKALALSINTLRNNLGALRRLGKYLRETGQGNLEISYNLSRPPQKIKTILTKKEVKELYEAAGADLLGLRDKAMLSVFYGCGLRRNEGKNLNITDIFPSKNKILVRKGKGYKERFVPVTQAIREDIEKYLVNARSVLTAGNPTETAFFISTRGTRLSGQMLYERLQQLKEKAGIEKDLPAGAGIGLHTLRHSIATHLLKEGMKIEMVSRFLGHSSLESTQIYTHLSAVTE
jgi:integrase/recombinase XerD